MKYPNGRTLNYGYGSGGSLTDRTSRVATISEGTTTLVTYSHLGSSQLVSKYYNQPEIERTLATGSGANPYAALDRFGRLVDLRWTDVSTKPAVDLVHFNYGYDRVSNRLYERNTISTGANPGVDSLFGFDQLNRLTQLEMGTLNSSGTAITSPHSSQDWVLDETGNFVEFTQGNVQSGVLTTTLDQTRVHNSVNEITNITETIGAAWATPAHDATGNMTAIPQPLDLTDSFGATWDAWNRLVKLVHESFTVAVYEYDGNNRRIAVKKYVNGSLSETRHDYYSSSQAIEERIGTSTSADRQWVWNLGYVDDLILRDRDTNSDGTLDERLYALYDLRFSVMALADTSGTIVERYQYEAHGRTSVMTGLFAARSVSSYDWDYRYTGRQLDLATGLYYFRARYFSAELGRFISRDPLGYVDGMSLYRGYSVSGGVDSTGLDFNDGLPFGDEPPVGVNPEPTDIFAIDGRAIDALEWALGSCLAQCFVLGMRDEEIKRLVNKILNDTDNATRTILTQWAQAKALEGGVLIVALLREFQKTVRGHPQGTTISGNLAARLAPKSLKAFQRSLALLSLRLAGKGGSKLMGRVGAKAVPLLGQALLAVEGINCGFCAYACSDGKFNEVDKYDEFLLIPAKTCGDCFPFSRDPDGTPWIPVFPLSF